MKIQFLFVGLLALGGCNSGDSASQPDLSPTPDLAWPIAVFPSPPQVVTATGHILAAPSFIPVFFSNDSPAQVAPLEDFLSKVGGTAYWTAVTTEYGVGAGSATKPVALTETATGTIDDAAIQTWLEGKLNSNDPAFPAPTENSIYVLNYPLGVTITLAMQKSCDSFGAYHGDVVLDAAHSAMNVAYAVIPRCPANGGLTSMQTTTAATSHELIEASTDPYPDHNPAYSGVDEDHRYWSRALGGGEVGDMCAQNRDSFTQFPELAYTVQRSWSNAAALAGHDPCVPPLVDNVYFNAGPVFTDSIPSGPNGMFMSLGVSVPAGTSKTVDLKLFSDADTGGPWTVTVDDMTMQTTPHYQFTVDPTSGQNGDTLKLTITTLVASTRGTDNFVITSKLGTKTHEWYGLIGDKAITP